MNTKEKENLLLKRDILLLLTDFELDNEDRTVEQIQEMKDYKIYLKNLPENNFEIKQPPEFYKVSRVYNLLIRLNDKL